MKNLDRFKGAVPYASEMYGLYQPLLGWKSRLGRRRAEAGWEAQRRRILSEAMPRLRPQYVIDANSHPLESSFRVAPADRKGRPSPFLADATSSLLAKRIAEEAGTDVDRWIELTKPKMTTALLDELRPTIQREHHDRLNATGLNATGLNVSDEVRQARSDAILNAILTRESLAAGVLHAAHNTGDPEIVGALLAPVMSESLSERFAGAVHWHDDSLISANRLGASLSPIGLVHLYRQFFFEFDTFLGQPVHHIWLSPGSSVEMVESTTTRKVVERTVDVFGESRQLSEQSGESSTDLSDTIKSDNESNSKFGVSINTTSSFKIGPIYTGQVSTGTSYDASTTQKSSREQMHKALRRQSEKASVELRRSIRTTFKTTTETTDTTSRRYLLANTTTKLVNYEMRRKMRQVGVQVQDAGTQLCWQVFVDKPGDSLGLGNLVHVAAPTDLEPVQVPEQTPTPLPYAGDMLRYSFTWPLDDDDEDPAIYKEFHVHHFPVIPKPGYRLAEVEVRITSEPKWGFTWRGHAPEPVGPGSSETTFTSFQLYLPNTVDGHRLPLTDEHPRFDFELTPKWVPSSWLLAKVASDNAANSATSTEKTKREFTEKIYASVAERVTKASQVTRRPAEELREEERIVVYRFLITQLMAEAGISHADARLHHIFAELVQATFDIDRMLYFVAPEWWLPHSGGSQQDVIRPDINGTTFESYHTVDWGGSRASRPNNYLISSDSEPAPLGASLGWTLQLDGDNLRNAFLNAPWVKAIVPIRSGREHDAIEWLTQAKVEGTEGLDDEYQPGSGSELDAIRTALGLGPDTVVTIRHAIDRLILWLNTKASAERVAPTEEAPGFLRTDKVYEHGFDPLAGGFRADPLEPFEVFDQWVEVLPTDQVVPVPVEYNPENGQQI